jgi:GT2 family glycosyltransferase
MRAALVITTYNNPKSLGLCLKSFSNQSRKDFDIFVADDGSTQETKNKIESLQPLFEKKIQHRWHPDQGYKKAKINNDVFRELESFDVVLLVDHDVIVHHRFVEDHLALHEKHGDDFLFMGRRIDLGPELTESLNEKNVLHFNSSFPPPGLFSSFLKGETKNLSRAFRVKNPVFQRIFRRDSVRDLLGSNFSISRKLLWDVNGYDEDFSSYWGEDGDLFVRVRNSGAKILGLKSYALQYHLFHKRLEPKKEHEEIYAQRLRNFSYKRCLNGIFK